MPVTDVNKDLDALTMTITAEFDAGAERRLGDVVGPAAAGALVGPAVLSGDLRRPRPLPRRRAPPTS